MTAATKDRALHETIVMERTYKASPARVFAAWHDLKAREFWSAPSPETVIVYDQAEFRVGGLDISRCGENSDLRYLALVRYLEIVPDARIVFAERVSEAGVNRAAALITLELEPEGKTTKLKLTMQVTAFDEGMRGGYRHGWGAALDNLAAWLDRAT